MLSTTARRFSPAAALTVVAILGGSLSAASPASAQVPSRTTTIAPAATPVPTPTPAPARDPRPAAAPTDISLPTETTPDPPAPKPSGPLGLANERPMDRAKMIASLEKDLAAGGGPAGWSYSLMQNGKDVGGNGGGYARQPNDDNQIPGGLPFGEGTRMELMSVTKAITGIAIVRALDHANVSVDTPITPFLPSEWKKGKGFGWTSTNPVTFRHLLTHTSGINQAIENPNIDTTGWGNGWAGLAEIVADGVTPNVAAGSSYRNANFAMLRILLPELWAMADGPKEKLTENNEGFRYLAYVNNKLLAPAGIGATSCKASNDHANTWVYDRLNLGAGGRNVDFSQENMRQCGGHLGLHLSAQELVKLTSAVRTGETILSKEARQRMFDGRLGWSSGSDSAAIDTAGMWFHGGDGYWGTRELHTCVMNAPQGYQLALLMNSQRATNVSQCRILANAVNASQTL